MNNLTGQLIIAGIDESGLCRAVIQCEPDVLRAVEHLPMYKPVTVIETSELAELERFIYHLTLDLQGHRSLTDAQKDALFQQAYRFYVARNCDRFDAARTAPTK